MTTEPDTEPGEAAPGSEATNPADGSEDVDQDNQDNNPGHVDPAEQADGAEEREPSVSVLLAGRLSGVSDSAVLVDHGGKSVAPLTPDGGQYRFRMREHDRARTWYANDADALLSVLIDAYPDPASVPQQASAGEAQEETPEMSDEVAAAAALAAFEARVRHASGVIFNLFAAAVMAGDLSQEDEATLLASATHTEEQPAITNEQCERWTHPVHPMVLIRELYLPDDDDRPPGGNIYWIRAATAESYVQSLSVVGEIELQENPALTRLPPTMITSTSRPDPSYNQPTSG